MNENQHLREAMWDLVYGLVDPQDEQRLVERIKSEPEVARLYAEVRLESELVGQAAKVTDTSLVLAPPAASSAAPRHPVDVAKPAPSRLPKRSATWRNASRWLAAGATALLALLMVGLLWPATPAVSLGHVVGIDLLSSPALPGGISRKVELRTYDVSTDGQFKEADADVEVRLVSGDGRELLRQQVVTDRSGHAIVNLPGSAIEPGAKVEVTPAGKKSLAGQYLASTQVPVVGELPVQPEPQVAYFLAAEPTVAEGKPVDVSLWNFSAFSAKPAPAEVSRAAIEEVEGLKVTESPGTTSLPGILNARVELPEQTPAQSDAGLAKAKELAQGQRPQAAALAEQVDGQAIAPERQLAQRGELNFQRRARSQSRSLFGSAQRAEAVTPGASQMFSIGGDSPTIAAGQPIRLPLSAEMAAREIIATASCRGAQVATTVHSPPAALTNADSKQENYQAKKQQASPAELVLDLPPEADGLIEVALYDRTTQEPILLEQHQLYREPLQQLNIEVARSKDRYAPGEQVDLQLRVTDEAGRPAANARLGVRVWNELSVQQAAEPPVMLAEAVRNNYLAVAQEPSERSLNRSQAITEGGGGVAAPYRQQNRARGAASFAAGGIPGGSAERVETESVQPARAAAPTEPTADSLARTKPAAELADRAGPAELALPPADVDKYAADNAPATPATSVPAADESRAPLTGESIANVDSIELASNRQAIQAAVGAAVWEARNQRRRLQAALGILIVVGGATLLLLLALAALRHALRQSALLPLGAIGVACTLVGAMWLGGNLLRERTADSLAASPAAAPASDFTTQSARAEPKLDALATADPSRESSAGLQNSDARIAAGTPPAADPPTPTESPSAAAAPINRAEPPVSNALARDATAPLPAQNAAGQPQVTAPAASGGYGLSVAPARPGAAAETTAPPAVAATPLAAGRAPAAAPADAAAAAPAAGVRDAMTRVPLPGNAGAAADPLGQFSRQGQAELAGERGLQSERERQQQEAGANPAAPAALYFNPQLVTDAEGRAKIQLVMPPVESEYRLLIDALGQGRVGSRQDQLIVDDRPANLLPVDAK